MILHINNTTHTCKFSINKKFKVSQFIILLKVSARRIGKVSEEAELNIAVETDVERFKANIMDVVCACSNSALFAQIYKMMLLKVHILY